MSMPEPAEENRELVDEGDVDVALGVLDDLRGLGDPDRRGAVGAGGDDRSVEVVDEVGHLGGGPRGHLDDRRQAVLAVAGVDPLRAVADVEVAVEGETGDLLEHRHAALLSGSGVDRGLVDDDVAATQRAGDRLGRGQDRGEVGLLVLVDGCRGRHDVDVRSRQVGRVVGEPQVRGGRQLGPGDLERVVVPVTQLLDPGAVDVVADDLASSAELDGQRQPDVAQTDDRDGGIPHVAERRAHGPAFPVASSSRAGTAAAI